MATTTMTVPPFTTIELLTPHGPAYRQVSTAPPRPPTTAEMPLVDLSSIDGDREAREALALKIKAAAENTGFFYVYNHGIPEQLIQEAQTQVKKFFAQPASAKEQVSHKYSAQSSGYHAVGATQVNKTESRGKHTVSFFKVS